MRQPTYLDGVRAGQRHLAYEVALDNFRRKPFLEAVAHVERLRDVAARECEEAEAARRETAATKAPRGGRRV